MTSITDKFSIQINLKVHPRINQNFKVFSRNLFSVSVFLCAIAERMLPRNTATHLKSPTTNWPLSCLLILEEKNHCEIQEDLCSSIILQHWLFICTWGERERLKECVCVCGCVYVFSMHSFSPAQLLCNKQHVKKIK